MSEAPDKSTRLDTQTTDPRLVPGETWVNTEVPGEDGIWQVKGETPDGTSVVLTHKKGGEITLTKTALGIYVDEHESDPRPITKGFKLGQSMWKHSPEKKS